MNRPTHILPPRVTRARERLERAVAAMEAVIEDRIADSGADESDIDVVRAENRALREATETVSMRLDAAIDRLRAVLDE